MNNPLAETMVLLYGFLAVHLPFHWLVGRFGRRGYQYEYAESGVVMENGACFGSCEQTLEFVAREG